VRPVTGVANPGQLIALAAAVGFGISIAMVKSLTGTELTLAIIFWISRRTVSSKWGLIRQMFKSEQTGRFADV
jgi:uncharacterized membrane protein YdjX (TVP38/TMEM64 family)